MHSSFGNGLGSAHDPLLTKLGCTNPADGYVPPGIDVYKMEKVVAHGCGVTLPRIENGEHIGLLDTCGGSDALLSPGSSDAEYLLFENLSCLYDGSENGHSMKVGLASDAAKTPVYGKWETRETRSIPALDACSAHFGVTPDSNGQVIYHHHVSGLAPFMVGCYGPAGDENGYGRLVSLNECRALHPECGDGDEISVTTAKGTSQYDPHCPCFKENSNVSP